MAQFANIAGQARWKGWFVVDGAGWWLGWLGVVQGGWLVVGVVRVEGEWLEEDKSSDNCVGHMLPLARSSMTSCDLLLCRRALVLRGSEEVSKDSGVDLLQALSMVARASWQCVLGSCLAFIQIRSGCCRFPFCALRKPECLVNVLRQE